MQIRGPKSEIRKKVEGRNPKGRCEWPEFFAFGLQVSGFFRASAFGFRTCTFVVLFHFNGWFHVLRTNNFPGSCLTTRFISSPSNATLTAELGKLLRRMTSSMLDSSLFNAS